MKSESKQEILKRRKEIEQELVDMLKETESGFTLDHVRGVIYHEEDSDGMMKVVAIFDRGGNASELSNVLELQVTPIVASLTEIKVRDYRNPIIEEYWAAKRAP